MAGQPQTAATSAPSALEQVLRRDRAVVVAAILIIAAIAWAYTVYLAETGMSMSNDMGMSMAMADMRSWSAADFGLMFVMWAVMMVAMMAPSAAPMLLMFAALNRRRRERDAPYVPTGIFLAGYVVVWTAFAAAATGGNWGLHQASLLSSMMGASTSGYLGGALLLAAGAFQWSPLKIACLKQCRTPMGFLMTSWREGHRGRAAYGLGARGLLPGMLLGADAALICTGRDEPGMDCRPCRLRVGRKSRAHERVGQPWHRRIAGGLGGLGLSLPPRCRPPSFRRKREFTTILRPTLTERRPPFQKAALGGIDLSLPLQPYPGPVANPRPPQREPAPARLPRPVNRPTRRSYRLWAVPDRRRSRFRRPSRRWPAAGRWLAPFPLPPGKPTG